MIARTSDDGGKRFSLWPWLLGGLLAVHASFLIGVAFIASSDRSFAVEPDYYGSAVAWDESQAARRASAALGWQAHGEIGAATGLFGDRMLEFALRDDHGDAIDDAVVEVTFFHHARAKERRTETLPPLGDGSYGMSLPLRRGGLWEVRLKATRADDVFLLREMIEVERSRP